MARSLEQELGDRIRQARREAGLTAEQMAPLIGVTLATIYRHETGKTKQIGFARLVRIAEVTGKPLSWFFTDNGNEEAA